MFGREIYVSLKVGPEILARNFDRKFFLQEVKKIDCKAELNDADFLYRNLSFALENL